MNPAHLNRQVVARAIYAVTAKRVEDAMSDPDSGHKHMAPKWEELTDEERWLNEDYAIAALEAIQDIFGV